MKYFTFKNDEHSLARAIENRRVQLPLCDVICPQSVAQDGQTCPLSPENVTHKSCPARRFVISSAP
jgi:hypothetical protein